MRCVIDGISYDGAGVGRINGQAVFIPLAIPGETVEAEIINNKKRYAVARLVEVLEASPDRIQPACPHFYECGGCSYQHVDYSRQLSLKQQVVTDTLKRIGKIEAPVNLVIGMNQPWRYRNKVTWHVSKAGKMGFYQDTSRELAEIKTCKLISSAMEQVSNIITEHLGQISREAGGEIIVRQSSLTRDIMLVFNGPGFNINRAVVKLLANHCSSIYHSNGNKETLLYGEPYLYEEIDGIRFRLSPRSFFQVNNEQAHKLITIIKGYWQLKGHEQILDAYCGIGSIALCLARNAACVIGVESYPLAVEDARANALANQVDNCHFINGLCEKILPLPGKDFDTVILDPPRSGCKKEVITAITQTCPDRIIYVSCNPATLARDLAIFAGQGYLAKEVQPVDMFSWTRHVECIILMTNSGSKGK